MYLKIQFLPFLEPSVQSATSKNIMLQGQLLSESVHLDREIVNLATREFAGVTVGHFNIISEPARVSILAATTAEKKKIQSLSARWTAKAAAKRQPFATVDGSLVPLEKILRSNGLPDLGFQHPAGVNEGTAYQNASPSTTEDKNTAAFGMLDVSALFDDRQGSRQEADGLVLRCVKSQEILFPMYIARFNPALQAAITDCADPDKRHHMATSAASRRLFGRRIKHKQAMHKSCTRRVVIVPKGAVLESVRMSLD